MKISEKDGWVGYVFDQDAFVWHCHWCQAQHVGAETKAEAEEQLTVHLAGLHRVRSTVVEFAFLSEGEHPTTCDECGSTNMKEVGLVAPKCGDCGSFSISHLTMEKVR